MNTPNLNLMSMEELSRLTRNVGIDKLTRQGALRELCKRENNRLSRYHNRIKPTHYAAHYLD